jgi:hypothetical protein
MSPTTPSRVPAQRPSVRTAARTVVVGVDGSTASVRALIWAFQLATDHSWAVEVLTVWPLHGPVLVHEVAGHFSEPRWRARDVQAAAVARAVAAVDEPPSFALRVVNGTVVDALSVAGRRSAMIVIGSDGPPTTPRRRRRLSELIRQFVPDPVVVVGPAGPAAGDLVPASDRSIVGSDPVAASPSASVASS